jgi:hypothetical protein
MVKERIPNTNDMQALKSHERWAGAFIESVTKEKQLWPSLTYAMPQHQIHRE